MARIRTIKPEFWEDDTIGILSLHARLLFIATWNVADDEGLLRWTAAYLKSVAFRYDWEITEAAVADMMTELADNGMVHPYQGGKAKDRLGWIVNFHKHQKVNRPQPSRLAAPSLQNPAILGVYMRRDNRKCHLCNRIVRNKGYESRAYPSDAASLDHVIPVSAGGGDHPTNIRVSHVGCNKARRDRPVEEYRQMLKQRGAAALPLEPSAAPPPDDPQWTDAVNSSSTDSLNDADTSSVNNFPPGGNTQVSNSLNDSVNNSLPEWNGKGKEGKGKPPAVTRATRTDARDADLATLTAQTITAAWVDRVRSNGVEPPKNLIGQAARTVKQLLDGGNDPQRVLSAACLAASKGFATVDRELLRANGDPDADRRDPNTGRIVDWA